LLFGYDPHRDLHPQHLARLVERVVEESLTVARKPVRPGQPAFDPRLCAKVLIYGYATGVRSSRQLERQCQESLPYLFLTRGQAPSYRTLCSFRVDHSDLIETVWVGLFAIAAEAGIARLGRIVVDSSKIRANAGPEAVVKQDEYEAVVAELKQILAEATAADQNEENTSPGTTQVETSVPPEQMRDILRRVRKQRSAAKRAEDASSGTPPSASSGTANGASATSEPHAPLGARMHKAVQAALKTLEAAQQEGRAHACLTDPDARMMGEGREKRIRECHSFEVAVDNGLLVVGQTCQSPVDNPRLKPLLEAAQKHEPNGITALDADSGYYAGETIADLIETGLDVCIPDANTAGDLRRGDPVGTNRQKTTGSVELLYNTQADEYTCPQGNVLTFRQLHTQDGKQLREYRAQQECSDCPLRVACGKQARGKYRALKVSPHADVLTAHLKRFTDPVHLNRYHQRAHAVETVFGHLRLLLGYTRWFLRGSVRVASEARLFTAALQLRKVHSCLTQV
jgi:transposase